VRGRACARACARGVAGPPGGLQRCKDAPALPSRISPALMHCAHFSPCRTRAQSRRANLRCAPPLLRCGGGVARGVSRATRRFGWKPPRQHALGDPDQHSVWRMSVFITEELASLIGIPKPEKRIISRGFRANHIARIRQARSDSNLSHPCENSITKVQCALSPARVCVAVARASTMSVGRK